MEEMHSINVQNWATLLGLNTAWLVWKCLKSLSGYWAALPRPERLIAWNSPEISLGLPGHFYHHPE
eukprot:scaffold3870_cov15-Tisochrysis_lutea.AAC.1